MRRLTILIALLACLGAGSANAQTAAGTLITNIVSATEYFSNLGVQYSMSFDSTAIILVAQPEVQLYKSASPTMACSGGTVTFCIQAVNDSAFTSAFNVVLDDPMPVGFAYIKGGQELWPSGLITMGYTHPFASTGNCNPCDITWNDDPPDGEIVNNFPLFLKTLRWVVSELGPNQSALICFKVRLL